MTSPPTEHSLAKQLLWYRATLGQSVSLALLPGEGRTQHMRQPQDVAAAIAQRFAGV